MASLLAAACAAILFLAHLRPAPPPPFAVLQRPFQLPISFRDRVDRFIPSKTGWRWAWNVEQRLFGARKPVFVQANIVSFADPPPTLVSNLALGPPNFSDSGGLSVWLMPSNQLSILRGNFKQAGARTVSQPRVSTAEGLLASLFIGQSLPSGSSTCQVGLQFDCGARFRRDSSDLLTHIFFSELVTNENDGSNGYAPSLTVTPQTNIDMALRLQVPKGRGVFFLDQSSRAPSHGHMGVLIDPL